MKPCLWTTASTAMKLHTAYSTFNLKFIPEWFLHAIFLSIFFRNYHSLMALPVRYYCKNIKCS